MAKEKDKKKSTVGRTLHYFWKEIWKYKWFSLGMLLTTPAVIFVRAVLAPLIFAHLIDRVSSGEIPADELWQTLLPVVLAFAAAYFVSSVLLEKLRLWFCWKMEIKAMYNIATMCFDSLLEQSMQFHANRFSGSLVSQTNKFTYAFERLVDEVVWNILPTISFLVFSIIVLWQEAYAFALVLVGFSIVYTIISFVTYKRTGVLNETQSKAETKQNGQLADSISNVMAVKSYGRETHERKRYAGVAGATFNASRALMRAIIKRDVAFSVVYVGIIVAIVVFLIGGPGWFGISVGTLILIVTYSQGVMGDLWNVNQMFRNMNRVFGDAHEMTLILDETAAVKDVEGAKELKAIQGKVVFDNVSFRHPDAKEAIFENFTLDIEAGERIGLVGVSGSGKTTLTKLLLRFADVDAGEITIDGQDIREVTQVSLREDIAYVPQETALFHRSIAENIAYGKPEAGQGEIENAAQLANAEEFIDDLPKGYETLVGERGVKLSGGQRQRVAIARAILKDAPILVLDEATSALDSESEALIQGALKNLMRGRTSIVIAHRLSTVASLDRIVVLKEGKIVEQGCHAELLKNGKEYAKLWNRQTGAFLEEE